MDLRLNEEQKQFVDSLERWVEKNYSFEERKKIIYSDTGCSNEKYKELADFGAIALAISEEDGGIGGKSEDLMLVMRELGKGIVVEPYFTTIVSCQFLKGKDKSNILKNISDGDKKVTFALLERNSGYALNEVKTKAVKSADGYTISGEKTTVLYGAQSDYIILSARTSGDDNDKDGISLFLIDSKLPGVQIVDYRTFDGQRAATLKLSAVSVSQDMLIGEAGNAFDEIERVADFAVAMLCSEAVGIMETANKQTLEYLKNRKQFGVPIGTFQVLQHRMADMYMHAEQAKSITTLAAVKVNDVLPEERRKLVSAAKVRVGQAMKFVGQQAIQMHGGMGMTNEMAISHYFKRLTAIEMTLGSTDFHKKRFISLNSFKNVS